MASLVVIVGPTASGKTALSIDVAKKYKGEIICADSQTIYKGLSVGTAKPSVVEQDGIPHYGLDLVEPYEQFSAADFQKYANEKIAEIRERGNLPIIVGGTGLYVDGVIYGYEFGDAVDPRLRAELEELDIEELQDKIITAGYEMPENSQNKRYLIRAIEQGGVNRRRRELEPGVIVVGIDPGREKLEDRIRLRAHDMVENGVLEEVRLFEEDYGWEVPGAKGNIYQALRPYIEYEGQDIVPFLEDFVRLDLGLAKRQRTWFKRNKDITWFENAESAAKYLDTVL